MKIINFEQGSPEWLEWRKTGIGASEIAAIMGLCSFRTPMNIYLSKQPEYIGYTSEAMLYGTRQEVLAKEWAQKELGCILDNLCVEDEKNSWIKGSLDAITKDHKMLIEIKSPFNPSSLEKLKSGEIPISYQYQLQWQMMITELDQAFLMVWDGFTGYWFPYKADKKLHKNMQKEGWEFWKNLLKGTPPKDTHEDISNAHPNVDKKMEIYRNLKESIKEKQELLKELDKEFEEIANGKNVILHGLRMTRIDGRVSYDYSLMKKDGIDIEKYKKTGKESYRKYF